MKRDRPGRTARATVVMAVAVAGIAGTPRAAAQNAGDSVVLPGAMQIPQGNPTDFVVSFGKPVAGCDLLRGSGRAPRGPQLSAQTGVCHRFSADRPKNLLESDLGRTIRDLLDFLGPANVEDLQGIRNARSVRFLCDPFEQEEEPANGIPPVTSTPTLGPTTVPSADDDDDAEEDDDNIPRTSPPSPSSPPGKDKDKDKGGPSGAPTVSPSRARDGISIGIEVGSSAGRPTRRPRVGSNLRKRQEEDAGSDDDGAEDDDDGEDDDDDDAGSPDLIMQDRIFAKRKVTIQWFVGSDNCEGPSFQEEIVTEKTFVEEVTYIPPPEGQSLQQWTYLNCSGDNPFGERREIFATCSPLYRVKTGLPDSTPLAATVVDVVPYPVVKMATYDRGEANVQASESRCARLLDGGKSKLSFASGFALDQSSSTVVRGCSPLPHMPGMSVQVFCDYASQSTVPKVTFYANGACSDGNGNLALGEDDVAVQVIDDECALYTISGDKLPEVKRQSVVLQCDYRALLESQDGWDTGMVALYSSVPAAVLVAFVVYVCVTQKRRRGSSAASTAASSLGSSANDPVANRASTDKNVTRAAEVSVMGYTMTLLRVRGRGNARNDIPTAVAVGRPDGLQSVATVARTCGDFHIPLSELRLGALIGKGAHGRVYEGTFRNSTVAIKEFPHARSKRAFEREYRNLQALKHPNVIRLYGVVDEDSPTAGPRRMIVMDRATSSLAAFVASKTARKRKAPFKSGSSIATILQWAQQICSGMVYVHSKGLIHFDLKPENILFDGALNVKICDMGISRSTLSAGMQPATSEEEGGTPMYTAPEIYSSDRAQLTQAVDVYAFAIMFWQMLHDGPPFPTDWNVVRLISEISERGRRPTIASTLPEPLSVLLRASWARFPDDRPTFGELRHELHNMLGQRSVQAGDLSSRPAFENGQTVFVWDQAAMRFLSSTPAEVIENVSPLADVPVSLAGERKSVAPDNLLANERLTRRYV